MSWSLVWLSVPGRVVSTMRVWARFSAYRNSQAALQAAVARGVSIWLVVETLHGAGSALQGDQPAAAFDGLHGATLWTWALDRRADGAKMHAKIAVADQASLLVTSANLTASGMNNNIEAGVVIRGGEAPRRAAEHLHALRRDGYLTAL